MTARLETSGMVASHTWLGIVKRKKKMAEEGDLADIKDDELSCYWVGCKRTGELAVQEELNRCMR